MLNDVQTGFTSYSNTVKDAVINKSTSTIVFLLIPILLTIAVIFIFKIPVWKPAKKFYKNARRRTSNYFYERSHRRAYRRRRRRR